MKAIHCLDEEETMWWWENLDEEEQFAIISEAHIKAKQEEGV